MEYSTAIERNEIVLYATIPVKPSKHYAKQKKSIVKDHI